MGLAILHEGLGQDNCAPQEGVVMCSQSLGETKLGPIGQQREKSEKQPLSEQLCWPSPPF